MSKPYAWRENGILPASEIRIDQLEALPLNVAADRLLNVPGLYSHGHLSVRGGACSRGCCWNPWSPEVCFYRRRCTCHSTIVDEPAEHLGAVQEEAGEIDYEELMAA